MNERPAPLLPADVDLRSYDWFPLQHKRLTRSAWWLRASDRAKAISVEFWCEAYQQVPCASLPDDDIALSDIAGFGKRDLTQWLEAKDEVLSAWVLCSDGRWYHPTLAEVAVEAFNEREARREREREKKRRQRGGEKVPGDTQGDAKPVTAGVSGATIEPKAESPRGQSTKGEDKTEQKIEGSIEPSPMIPTKTKSSRGTRIPWDWTASSADRAYAVSIGLSVEEIRGIEEDFFDFWKAKAGAGGVKLDWAATWRTWCRRQVRGGPRGSGNSSGGTSGAAPRGRGAERDARIGSMLEGAMGALDRRRK